MVTYGSLPLDNFSESRKTVLALGLFDGVHRGHRRVIESAAQMAEESGAALGIFTFSVIKSCPDKKQGQPLITPRSVKHKLFRRLKVEYVFEPDFSEIKQIDAREFINDILINRLGAAGIACGYDFHFGAGAKADCNKLCEYAEQAGRRALVTPPQLAPDGAAISSTGIRKLIRAGEIRRANELLGYNYFIDFTVASGRRLGRKLGFPTINQEYPDGVVVPKFGVYAAAAKVRGRLFPAVTNIGVKPTVGGVKNPLAETYIIGVDDNLYGERPEVYLLDFLRDEKKFDSLDELKVQIADNAGQAQKIFDAAAASHGDLAAFD